MSRRCVLCGDSIIPPSTVCEHCKTVQPVLRAGPSPIDQAKEDARMFGIGFVVAGKRVSPQSVVVVREPRDKALDFEDFWLREGPSLAWDEDRKRAARRIWDAARKGSA